jgi:hypothetical protein
MMTLPQRVVDTRKHNKKLRLPQSILIKHKTIDTPKIVNIFILYVSTINLSHLQKNAKGPFTRAIFAAILVAIFSFWRM